MTITPDVNGVWKLEVAAFVDGESPTAWSQVGGINELTPATPEKNLEDDSEFDGSYGTSQVATGIAWTAEAKAKRPRVGLSEDPGQAILKTAGEGVLEDGMVHTRWIRRGETTGKQGVANVEWKPDGGSKTDLETVTVSFTGRGVLTEYTATP